MIRIAFRYADRRLASRLICAWRGGDSAHCEVACAWAGERHECVSASFVDRGVRGKAISMPASKWRIYEGDGDPVAVLQWLAEHDGEGYGWLKLLRFFIGLRIRIGGPICSEVCAHFMGLPEPWLFDPRALESVCASRMRRVQ